MDEGKKTIKPDKVGGFLDYLPPVMIARNKMLSTIEAVYQSFGFLPLDTPAVERLEVLTGNRSGFQMNLYRTVVASGLESISDAAKRQDMDLALRFDLTVPLSRVVAAYSDKLPKPFKRYQVGKVWRGERSQAGRYREFVQFDADIIGCRSVIADTEIIQIMHTVMTALGFENFLIRINNRKIFEALNEIIGLDDPEKREELIRIIDKRDKVGDEELKAELMREPDNQYDPAPNLSAEKAEKVMRFIAIQGSCDEILAQAESVVGSSKIGGEGVAELRRIADNLRSLAIPEANWKMDLSIARGLGYYTGPVFETVLTDLPEIGSVYSGGRFDGLTNRFISNSNIPGTGASVGVDRLFAAMEKLGKIQVVPSLTKVLVTVMDPSLCVECLRIANEVRAAGIPTELYLEEAPLKSQLAYALKQEIPLVVIMGSDENEKGQVSLKNMAARSQEALDKSVLVSRIKEVIK
ncbi:MAG: histidine--tRNA ligase [Candidatus Nealsonbacteria bacterium RIFOXYB1_FULL_40_15]|uniref:Histidine--tRNA ligase n=1 Tax=Candidatus Nealsonbacteria bacterium RIFOXYB1_FULL_40_15 TaxID=1801677 RepID=A0A1G2EN44_9BACT|nr:MAG: histidine--tRNA ligase [Candidatus Nealsonbacteria bacterium RIFOXYB1_FULL_40_15]OGZ28547.1 MAG: histidine--tRNA ligase [Candidatus Nealsonbacteria bacterium RIFOXYD1_FULL_39_11]